MDKSIGTNGSGVGGTFIGGDGITYRWKTHKRRFQLVKADNEGKIHLAERYPYKRYFVFCMFRHTWLKVKPKAAAALEKIIVSYIIVERRRRQARIRIKLEHQ